MMLAPCWLGYFFVLYWRTSASEGGGIGDATGACPFAVHPKGWRVLGILVGSAVLYTTKGKPDEEARLMGLMADFLVRDDDRALFGLPALPRIEKPADKPAKQAA